MDTISDNLIHFLGRKYIQSPQEQFKIFSAIIENGLRASPISIKFPGSGVIYNQIVCFTDLPLKFCDNHTSIYGKFGIGFKKSFIKNVGGNPAMYFVDYEPTETNDERIVESRGIASHHFGQIQNFILEISNTLNSDSNLLLTNNEEIIFDQKELNAFKEAFIYSLSFLKEIGDLGVARDESQDIDPYYKEREWRLVPSRSNLINKTVTCNEIESGYYYRFRRSDVNCIIVPNSDMRKIVSEYLKSLDKDSSLGDYVEDPPPVFVYDDLRKW